MTDDVEAQVKPLSPLDMRRARLRKDALVWRRSKRGHRLGGLECLFEHLPDWKGGAVEFFHDPQWDGLK